MTQGEKGGWRRLTLGIVLISVAMAVAVGTIMYYERGYPYSESGKIVIGAFMFGVTGLSGLVCAVLGIVRLLARRKGT